MNRDIIAGMRTEEAALLRKLKAVRELLAVYGEAEASKEERVDSTDRAAPTRRAREKVEITAFSDQTRKSVVLAMLAMSTAPRLMKTRELVDFVSNMKHEISGENKINALGALLARSLDIESHGKSGWSLANREKARAIIHQYGPKQNEPSSENAVGSDAASESGATLDLAEFHSS